MMRQPSDYATLMPYTRLPSHKVPNSEADRESEQAVIWTLKRAFPDHAVLAEENGGERAAERASLDY